MMTYDGSLFLPVLFEHIHRSNAKASDLRGGLTSEISATEKQRFINELSHELYNVARKHKPGFMLKSKVGLIWDQHMKKYGLKVNDSQLAQSRVGVQLDCAMMLIRENSVTI